MREVDERTEPDSEWDMMSEWDMLSVAESECDCTESLADVESDSQVRDDKLSIPTLEVVPEGSSNLSWAAITARTQEPAARSTKSRRNVPMGLPSPHRSHLPAAPRRRDPLPRWNEVAFIYH